MTTLLRPFIAVPAAVEPVVVTLVMLGAQAQPLIHQLQPTLPRQLQPALPRQLQPTLPRQLQPAQIPLAQTAQTVLLHALME